MRLTKSIPADLRLSIHIIKVLTVIIFVTSVAIAAYSFGYLEAEEATSALHSKVWASGTDSRSMVNTLHIIIAICLALSFLGVWTERYVGLLVSLLGFVGVIVNYFWWYVISADILKGAEIMHFPSDIMHIGPLIDATWWDIIVFAAALCLMIWVSAILLKALKRASVSSLGEN